MRDSEQHSLSGFPQRPTRFRRVTGIATDRICQFCLLDSGSSEQPSSASNIELDAFVTGFLTNCPSVGAEVVGSAALAAVSSHEGQYPQAPLIHAFRVLPYVASDSGHGVVAEQTSSG